MLVLSFMPATENGSCCSYILTAARLISPVIERSGPVPGFDWCIEALTGAQHSALASEVALAKAGWFLDHQAFGDAVSVLKVCLHSFSNVAECCIARNRRSCVQYGRHDSQH